MPTTREYFSVAPADTDDARLEYEARTVIADLIARHGEVKAAEMAFRLVKDEIERSRCG